MDPQMPEASDSEFDLSAMARTILGESSAANIAEIRAMIAKNPEGWVSDYLRGNWAPKPLAIDTGIAGEYQEPRKPLPGFMVEFQARDRLHRVTIDQDAGELKAPRKSLSSGSKFKL